MEILLKHENVSFILAGLNFTTPIKNIIDVIIGEKPNFSFFNDTQKYEIIASYDNIEGEFYLKPVIENYNQYSIKIDDFIYEGEIKRFIKKVKKSKSHKNRDNNIAFLDWIRNRTAQKEYTILRKEYFLSLLLAEISFEEAKNKISQLDKNLTIYRIRNEPDYERQIKLLQPLFTIREFPESFAELQGADENIILELIKRINDGRHRSYLEHLYGEGKNREQLEADFKRHNELSKKYDSTKPLEELEEIEIKERRKLVLETKWGPGKTLNELEYYELNENRIHLLEQKYGTGKNLFQLEMIEEKILRKAALERKYGMGKSIEELEALEKETLKKESEKEFAARAKGRSLNVERNYVPKLVEDLKYKQDLYG